MLPKKGRKEIIVDDVLYHYAVKPCISLIIRNSITGKITKWHQDCKSKWGIQLKPSDVEKIIRST
jgi:hypothetical protein